MFYTIIMILKATWRPKDKTWEEQIDGVLAHFHTAFAGTPAAEVEQDFQAALTEIRRSRANRENANKNREADKISKA